ncbi:uncharacterized protein [Dermacentor andersoni]|uniref:uncharacterized protein isoform X12 n=1 Tax=Dermacentor andersoni TaxID=34620 RepID=UPI002417455E|nr:mucin-5AC-like isoform X12 [Dermacentor andersoni]
MLRKELLVQCVLLLAALGWLGSDAASTATVGQTTPSSYQKSVSSTTSVTIATTTGDASTQGNRATVPLTTPSTSTASAISNATAATAGAVSTQGSTATVPLTTPSTSTASAISNATAATAGAVSTQGSTATVSRTTPSASTTSAVSNATAATAGAVSTQGSTATVSRTTPSASTTSAISNATAATAGAVSTQGSTATVSRTTPSASTTSAVSNATAGAVSTQGSTATVSRTTPSASTTSAVSNATAATAGAVSTQGSTATVSRTTPSASTTSAVSNATAATAGAVSTQGSTATVSRTTPSASTTSAVSNATAATAGAVSTQGSTATVSRTTPSASTTSAVSNATTGAVSTQGSTATVSRTTPSASTTSAVSNATAATAGAVSTQGSTATVSRTTPSASTTSAVSNATAATAGAVSTQGSTATVPLTTPSTSTASAISNATAALDLDAGCNEAVCSRPHCACASDKPPAGMRPDQVPQFVTLTFDDAVTVTNMAFYRELLEGFARKNKANGCGIAATFFVSHEYTDYAAVNALHSWGNEIAVHSISHRTDWDYWNTINSTQWEREMLDQKVMMETFANVPASDVTGVRGPFLYTGGDQLFRMQALHFRYDCTLVHQRVRRGAENPVYPYTMDFGFRRSCMVYPCPERTYPGLWVVPMNVLFREREGQDLPCAMADMCVPQPITVNETFEYLRSNFEDFYTTNRAPFPLFLHEAYLQQPSRKQGYLQFIDWLLQKDDVFLVTISEVLRFMQDPKPLGAYVQHTCPGGVVQSTCPKPNTCAYKNTSLGGDRYMTTCSQCPKNYPWVGNPMGN